jgi:hypothetical protein
MTKLWGYKILSDRSFNFYYADSSKIDIKKVARELDSFREISIEPNGSITIYTQADWLVRCVTNIKNFAERIDKV